VVICALKGKAKKSGGGAAKKPAKGAGKNKKKMPGKSISSGLAKVPAYKPTLYLENGQIPASIDKKKVGDKASITVDVKVMSKTERENRSGRTREVSLEVQAVK
jgi:hypothetical protein